VNKTILEVSFHSKVCGYLSSDKAQYTFRYDPKYLKSKNAESDLKMLSRAIFVARLASVLLVMTYSSLLDLPEF
jgi:hypothetical protein